jgi:acetolactate synthase-1/2/3 large subunit
MQQSLSKISNKIQNYSPKFSIVDAFAYRQHQGDNFPRPITVPHEIPLIGMAHGYYMLTGKPQAAMVHVGVGTANGLGALMAAQRARVPILCDPRGGL